MKNYSYILASLMLFISFFGLNAQDDQNIQEETITAEKVEVYYFHNTRRCATCQAVEDVTKSSLQELYPEQFKNGEITFKSLNIEDDVNETLAGDLKVSGQTLLVVKDGKKQDLTNDAFMYARTSPEKLKEKIKKAIGTI